jgi:hypothetical protein
MNNNEIAKEVLRNAMWQAHKTLTVKEIDLLVTDELQKMMDVLTALSKSFDFMERTNIYTERYCEPEFPEKSLKTTPKIKSGAVVTYSTPMMENTLIGYDLGSKDASVRATFEKQPDGNNKLIKLEEIK